METKSPTANKYTIGFDLGGSSLKYGYGNTTVGLLYFKNKPHKEKTLEGLTQLFNEALSDVKTQLETSNPDQISSFSAICIASPGIIDHQTGKIVGSTPNLPFIKDISLTQKLLDLSDLPVYIENDANLMTLAEAEAGRWSGDNPNHENRKPNTEHHFPATLGITIGSGIGTGYVYEGKILHGAQYKAMEAGHIIVVPDGRQCLCGKKGCFEAYCSADSIKRIIYEKHPETHDLTINTLLSSLHLPIQQTIYQILDIFAIAISNLVMTLNPAAVIIGGGVIEIPSFDFDYLKQQTYLHLSSEFKDFTIKKAQYGNKAGVLGAIIYGENVNNV